MKLDRDTRTVIMRRKGSALHPASQFDEECMMELAGASDVEVTFRQRRSNPQLRAYWRMLDEVVKATDVRPSAVHLHDTIKLDLGFVTQVQSLLTGEISNQPDSIAFAKMTGPEMTTFFERAIQYLTANLGIDCAALIQRPGSD